MLDIVYKIMYSLNAKKRKRSGVASTDTLNEWITEWMNDLLNEWITE